MSEVEKFTNWLAGAAQRVGAHSACCIRLDHPDLPAAIAANDQRVADWLAAGKQGEMDYLERMLPQKSNPWQTFPNAKAVIVLTFTNGWGDPAATHPFPVPESGAPVPSDGEYANRYATCGMRPCRPMGSTPTSMNNRVKKLLIGT